MSDSTVKFELYHYYPSTAAAAIFVALFSVVTAFHTFKVFQKRTWYFIPFLIGGYCEFCCSPSFSDRSLLQIVETIGYVGRVLSSRQSPNWTTTPYIIQSLLLLLGPALFAASIYMILGRIIRLVDGEKHSIIKVKWLTSIFVTGDILSFFVQSGGMSHSVTLPVRMLTCRMDRGRNDGQSNKTIHCQNRRISNHSRPLHPSCLLHSLCSRSR
jgi:hypothetical protein